MAFRRTDYGWLVTSEPQKAVKRLKRVFARNDYDVGRVAEELGVNRTTLFRWLRKLQDSGCGDPRDGKRAKTGRKPKLARKMKKRAA